MPFDLLHEGVRRWVARQGWAELRDIQARSIPLLLGAEGDLVIAAGTASGKTEAAFLPIVSRIAREQRPAGCGFEAIYVSPLRALINDQFGRMETLCSEVGVPVWKWHGDVSASVKAQARKRPAGILLTTPESLEAIFVRRGTEASRLFAALGTVVVDEAHAFMDAERGRQLQSLLERLERAIGRKVVRVGLSATLSDMRSAAAFIRPTNPQGVRILQSEVGTHDVRLQLRGYVQARVNGPSDDLSREDRPDWSNEAAIVRDLFRTSRGQRSLIFAGSRGKVEYYTVSLCELCEAQGVPEEFFAHHGSLSRDHREEVERRLKDESQPGSIVATTTLELGIDVGKIDSVSQIGPGHTVSGMRQRLGRSGRRAGQPSVMRVYTAEHAVDERSRPIDAMRSSTVQAIAMINLMVRRWNEPPNTARLHLSTLVHQILALIAQHGGLSAQQGWERLIANGLFPGVDRKLYVEILRRMGHADVRLIEQASDGTLLPGEEGERVIADRGFYSVFTTPDEFKVVTDRGKSLGTLPVADPAHVDAMIVFAGRRWRIVEVDAKRHEIVVTAASGGVPPTFGGGARPPHEVVVTEMRRVYEDLAIPTYLDATAIQLLAEARKAFDHLGLRHGHRIVDDGDILLFPWVGGRAQLALVLALAAHGIKASSHGIAVMVASDQAEKLDEVLRGLASAAAPDPLALAQMMPDMRRAKYDAYLGDDLLGQCFAAEHIDAERVPVIASALIGRTT